MIVRRREGKFFGLNLEEILLVAGVIAGRTQTYPQRSDQPDRAHSTRLRYKRRNTHYRGMRCLQLGVDSSATAAC